MIWNLFAHPDAEGLAAVPAFVFRQLKFITKVQKCSFVQHLFFSRYSGKPLLAEVLVYQSFQSIVHPRYFHHDNR